MPHPPPPALFVGITQRLRLLTGGTPLTCSPHNINADWLRPALPKALQPPDRKPAPYRASLYRAKRKVTPDSYTVQHTNHSGFALIHGDWHAVTGPRQQEKGEEDRYRGGMMPGEFPATAGSLYRVLAETPYTSTTCRPGVKVSFWLRQKAYAGDRLFFLFQSEGQSWGN